MTMKHVQELVNIGYQLACIQEALDCGEVEYHEWDQIRNNLLKRADDIALEYAPDYEDDPAYWQEDALQ